jgi:hypothetical protein
MRLYLTWPAVSDLMEQQAAIGPWMWPVQSFRGAWGGAFRNNATPKGPAERGITIKETTMNTNTNTNTSALSEIRGLTDDELDAVNGGAVSDYFRYGCANGSHIGVQIQLSGSSECKGTN